MANGIGTTSYLKREYNTNSTYLLRNGDNAQLAIRFIYGQNSTPAYISDVDIITYRQWLGFLLALGYVTKNVVILSLNKSLLAIVGILWMIKGARSLSPFLSFLFLRFEKRNIVIVSRFFESVWLEFWICVSQSERGWETQRDIIWRVFLFYDVFDMWVFRWDGRKGWRRLGKGEITKILSKPRSLAGDSEILFSSDLLLLVFFSVPPLLPRLYSCALVLSRWSFSVINITIMVWNLFFISWIPSEKRKRNSS